MTYRDQSIPLTTSKRFMGYNIIHVHDIVGAADYCRYVLAKYGTHCVLLWPLICFILQRSMTSLCLVKPTPM